ncbi:MAG TPA: DUF167 domain-containing protein [Terriglobia bacterium]|nr:DUF167 domain-containing protein [Terriglobia bacterium]
MSPFRVEGMRVTFRATVKPRASRDRLRIDSAGNLRLEVRAAPVDGNANAALIKFLAQRLRVPQNSIEIAMGSRSRQKLFRITGHPPYVITDRLMKIALEK